MDIILILLLLITIPQILTYVPDEIRLGPLGVHVFDIFTGMAFVWWLHYCIIAKNTLTLLQVKLNNIYIIILCVGFIPVVVGALYGKDDLLSTYRFFFYFVWLPVLVRFLQKHHHPKRIVYYIIVVNLLSSLMALYKHFTTVGFRLGYLEIHNEMNLFILMTLLALCLCREHLFGRNKKVFIIFFLFLIVLMIDQSRKMYLAFALGGMLLCINNFKDRSQKEKSRALAIGLAMMLLILVLFRQFGWSSDFASRVKSIGVIPGVTDIRTVDRSIGFRMSAWQASLRVIRSHPFFGTGTGENKLLLDEIEKEKIYYGFGGKSMSPHNFYLSMLASFGIPVVVFIFCVIFYLLKLSWRNMKKLPITNYAIAQGVFFGFIGFAVAMFFEGLAIFTILDLWVFLGLVLGFANLNPQQQPQSVTTMNFSRKPLKTILQDYLQ